MLTKLFFSVFKPSNLIKPFEINSKTLKMVLTSLQKIKSIPSTQQTHH